MRFILPGLALIALGGNAMAEDAPADEPPVNVAPMNTGEVDPDMLKDFHGPWEIRDATGKKVCKVVLTDAETIGGSVIEVDPECAKAFPVMDEIAAWRLMEGWGIDLVDAVRATRIRLTAPDETGEYRAEPETDGISTIVQLPPA